jgi:diacylglycerol O-acyltransferase
VQHATLPAPGGDAELHDWISDFYSHRLDRHRPLWELVVLDGLANGRWALASKTHHCLADGVGSVDLMRLLLALCAAADAPGEAEPRSFWEALSAEAERLPTPLQQTTRVSGELARGAFGALMHPREALSESQAALALVVRDELHPAPAASINRPIGSSRSIVALDTTRDELEPIARPVVARSTTSSSAA